MGAKFISAAQAGRELLGVKELLSELKLQVCEPMPMWMNNQSSIKQLEAETSTSSAKHVDIRFKPRRPRKHCDATVCEIGGDTGGYPHEVVDSPKSTGDTWDVQLEGDTG